MRRWFSRIALVGLAFVFGLIGARLFTYLTWEETRSDSILSGPYVFMWNEESPFFGGISGLLIEEGGTQIIASSDKGTIFTGRVLRSSGAISAINNIEQYVAKTHNEKNPSEFKRDLEGLTRMEDGRIGLSFESYTRIQAIEDLSGAPKGLHPWDRFQGYFGNHAFEAIATLPGGNLIAIIEAEMGEAQSDAYIYDGKSFLGPVTVPRSPGYLITGADVGPDQCLYLVERQFHIASGFRFRVSRAWQTGGLWAADRPWLHEVLYESAPGRMGNAEGLSAWQAGDAIRLTLVTDDGFWPMTPTRLIEFSVLPGTSCR